MLLETTHQNLLLAKEKKDKELQGKRDRLAYEKYEVKTTIHKGIKQEYT
jgi:hypothetical protein